MKVWIVTAGRLGDMKQLELVAQALGFPFTVKHVRFLPKPNWRLALWPERNLAPDCGNPFDRETPDLVLCAEASASALAAAAKRRGGRFKLVCIGRPRGRFSDFDLIITSPQYVFPRGSNVVELPLPPHARGGGTGVDAHPSGPFQAIRRPVTAVLVGGTSKPDILDQAAADTLATAINGIAADSAGTAVVLTSPRTGAAATEQLQRSLRPDVQFLPWVKGEPSAYSSVLAVADSFLVTSDTVSMVVDALLTGKPVTVHALPQKISLVHRFIAVLVHQRWAHPLFNFGLLEVRPDREKLFRSLSASLGLGWGGIPPQPVPVVPETAAAAAKHIRQNLLPAAMAGNELNR